MSDFSRGLKESDLEVSSVHHKSSLDVDEEGTEAAAASGNWKYVYLTFAIEFIQ